jgi:hypothetical protein
MIYGYAVGGRGILQVELLRSFRFQGPPHLHVVLALLVRAASHLLSGTASSHAPRLPILVIHICSNKSSILLCILSRYAHYEDIVSLLQ